MSIAQHVAKNSIPFMNYPEISCGSNTNQRLTWAKCYPYVYGPILQHLVVLYSKRNGEL